MIFTFLTNKLGGYNSLRQKFKKSNSSLIKKIYLILNKGLQHETNSYLPFNNEIKGPINFLHGTYGIFISGGAIIGQNCTIYQQVTIGSNMLIDSKSLGSPTIGNNCLIGAGAKIIGNVHIGNNCRIGANTVVTKDLPDNSVIVLSTPIIYQKNNLVNNIYQKSPTGWGYRKNGLFVIEMNNEKLKLLNNLK
ncbi:MAG: serine acetyltransferase [Lutibacter sp.]|nr:serine acetyltransferase [Lutibacter sp.]